MIRNAGYRLKIEQLIEMEKAVSNGKHSAEIYTELHTARFRKTLTICKTFVPQKTAHVLDVGRSNLTALLASYYETVCSLGFDLTEDDGGHRETESMPHIRHIVFDLNLSSQSANWPDHAGEFDLAVICETLEHLSTAPEFTLLMLSSLLKPGGIMLVTVPNAVALSKRIKMLLGYHPFERIRFYPQNPGHFREYTVSELREMGRTCGLEVISSHDANFAPPGKRVLRNLIPSMREGLVALFRKPVQ